MTAHSAQLTDAAQLLCDAQSSGIPIQPLTQMYPNLDVAQAYSVQRLNLGRYIGQGRVLHGHKIGLTSAPMEELLGVNEPDFGYLLDSMMLPNGAEVAVSAFCADELDPDEWAEAAELHRDSWWPDFGTWLVARGGEQKTAPKKLGTRGLPPLEPAPGTYVHER